MSSLYSNYISERTHDKIIETIEGFVTYRYIIENTVYIIDIYTSPECRGSGVASRLADKVVEEAKQKGCTKLIGTVVPSAKNSTISLKVLLGYGMSLDRASNDLIVFRKEI